MVLHANCRAVNGTNLPRKGHMWPLPAKIRVTDGPRLPKEEF